MIQVLYGNEPYYISRKLEELLGDIDRMAVKRHEEWNPQIWDEARQLSLFSERQAILVKPSSLDCDEFEEYVKNPAGFADLIVIPETVDKRKKAYRLLKKKGMVTECNKLTEKQMQIFVVGTLKKLNAGITEEAYGYFIQRSGYFSDDGVTLHDVENALRQCAFAGNSIGKEIIDAFTEENNTEKVFALTNAILERREGRAFMLAKKFLSEKEHPIKMLALMERSFRLAYKASLYPEMDSKRLVELIGVPAYQYQAAMRYRPEQVRKALGMIGKSICMIKQGIAEPEKAFYLSLSQILQCLEEIT